MIRPTEVETRKGYRLWLKYSDGTAGEVDLSHLAGPAVCLRLGTSRDASKRFTSPTIEQLLGMMTLSSARMRFIRSSPASPSRNSHFQSPRTLSE